MNRLLILPCFFLLTTLHAQSVSPDSLLMLLGNNQPDAVLDYLEKESQKQVRQNKNADPISTSLAILAHQAKKDTANSHALRQELLQHPFTQQQVESLLNFLFVGSGKFITSPSMYFFLQDLAIDFADRHQEPRAQFAFLQQKFSMYQMMGKPPQVAALLRQMKAISKGIPYLAFQTDIQYGLYYAGAQHDSCAYYFEKMLEESKQWLGFDDPYFLYENGFGPMKDSSIVASTIREYAIYSMRKGDLKKAGELLITSQRLVPDTSRFGILKIQNQISLATLYTDLINPARALHYCQEAITLCDKYQFQRLRQTKVAATYGYALMGNGQYAEAIPELELAYREFPRGLNVYEPKRQALRRALASIALGDYFSAKTWRDSAARFDVAHDQEVRFLEALIEGAFACQSHQYAEASLRYRDAIAFADLSKAIGWKKEALQSKYRCEKERRYPQEALLTLEMYSKLSDSLYRTGQDVALFDIEAGYQKSLQDETIARLDAQNTVSKSRITAQKRYLMLVIAGLLIVSALLTLVWRMYQRIKVSNAIITKSMEEKNILLREIHHRVKNNLQVISSLLKLQSGYIKDDAAIQAIAEGRSRVQSMALLHQNLYKEDNLTGVNMNEYFENLIQGLFDTYNISPDRIRLHKRIAPISLDVDTVVPLGLITNELISNALKHAFPGSVPGNLYVELYEEGPHLILKVRDDGTGLSASAPSQGFGSKLIQSLSQKLEADITTRSTNGTEVMLTIREYRKAA